LFLYSEFFYVLLKKSVILFFTGIAIGIAISGLEAFWDTDHPEDSISFFIYSLTFGGFFANLSYYLILIVIMPFVAIPKLKKKLGPKSLHVYSFVAGVTFWGAIAGLYILLSPN
jgi:hypothetical protein